MISKLLLVRLKDASSTLLADLGLAQFVTEEPLSVSPTAWPEEAGLSHYGYVLENLRLKDKAELDKVIKANDGLTLLDINDDIDSDDALASVGLKVNESA